MHPNLSAYLNLDELENDARNLLRALQEGDPEALRRHYALDPLAGLVEPKLAEAHYLIAREYGYNSWQKLKENLRPSSWIC